MGVQGSQLRIAYKNPCRVATTTNITDLAAGAPDPVDDVSLAVGDRILVKDQSTGSQNGIYRVDTVGTGVNGAWSRTEDFDLGTSDQITAGLAVFIQEGTASALDIFALTTTGAITIGSTSLTFTDYTPIVGATGGTTEAVLVADGTGGTTLKATTVFIDTSDNLTGVASVVMDEQGTPAGTPGAGLGRFYVRDDTPAVPAFQDDTATTAQDFNLLHYSPLKRPCAVATTANITLTGEQTLDGVLTSSDRVLVWNQTTGSENGIYVSAAGAWSRASDFDDATGDHIEAGIQIYVQQGNNYGRGLFYLVTTGAITIGSTSLEFIPMAGLVRSDASGTEVLASGTITTAFTGGSQTGSSDLRDFSNATWWVTCTVKSSAARLDISIQWSEDDTNFDEQGTEVISSGTSTVSDYEAQFDISGDTATFAKHISLPTYGRRYAKFRVKADAGTPTVSAKIVRGA